MHQREARTDNDCYQITLAPVLYKRAHCFASRSKMTVGDCYAPAIRPANPITQSRKIAVQCENLMGKGQLETNRGLSQLKGTTTDVPNQDLKLEAP